MEDWDDYRFFLAVMRMGSASGAAQTLKTNHTTVSRRIAVLETRMGVRLFDRMRTGYFPTIEATRLLAAAEGMEASAHRLARLANAKDNRLTGKLVVTAPPVLIHYLLMPIVSDFRSIYPDITVHVDSTEKTSNLVSREADIAIRVTNAPLETLIGSRLTTNTNGLYVSAGYLDARSLTAKDGVDHDDLDWISVNGDDSDTSWQSRLFPRGREACRTDSKLTAIAAALSGLGIVELPQLIGDAEPRLVRLEGVELKSDKDIWILYHRDLRQTARVSAFVSEVRKHFR